MLRYLQRFPEFLFCFSLLIFLSACSIQPQAQGKAPGNSATAAVLHTTLKNCPATRIARPAVMPMMTIGKHATLFYAARSAGTNSIKSYDTVSRQRTTILTLAKQGPDNSIQNAQLSADGQWIIFTSQVEGKFALQMVRVDGQDLQTLYCTPEANGISALSLSPDQKTLVFSQYKQANTLYLLHLASGALQIELTPQNGQDYTPVKWRDNTSLYVAVSLIGIGGGPYPIRNRLEFDLLRDISKDASQQSTNLQQITLPASAKSAPCEDFDTTQSNTQIISSNCVFGGNSAGPAITGPGTIKLQSIAGGPPHLIYSNINQAITYARLSTKSTLLFLVDNSSQTLNPAVPSSQNGLWKINLDGTGLMHLLTIKANAFSDFNLTGYTPWSNTARDESMYALAATSSMNGADTQSLLFGTFNGNIPTIVDSTLKSDDKISLIGWSTH